MSRRKIRTNRVRPSQQAPKHDRRSSVGFSTKVKGLEGTTQSPDTAVADAISALPAIEKDDLHQIADCYTVTLPRVLRCSPPEHVYAWVRSMPLSTACAGGSALVEVVNLTHGSTPFLGVILVAIAYAFLLAVIGAFTILLIYRWAPSGYVIGPEQRRASTNAVRLVGIATALASASPLTGLPISILTARSDQYAIGGCLLLLLVASVMSNLNHVFAQRYISADPMRPLDRVGTRLVTLATVVHRCACDADAVTASHIRSVIRDLEMLARDAERFAITGSPWWDRAARSTARADGLRLATVIRQYKPLLAVAVSGDEFTAIARSLTSGASAWARNGLLGVLDEVPEVKPPRRFVKLLIRLGPAALLAGMAIAVPLCPPLNHDAQAADNFRAALLIGAALSLFGGAAQITDYMTTALEKSEFPK